jgi:hypothetical protein
MVFGGIWRPHAARPHGWRSCAGFVGRFRLNANNCGGVVRNATVGFTKKKDIVALVQKKNVCRPLLVLSLVWQGAPLPTFDQTTSSYVHHFFQREQHTMMASGYGGFQRLWPGAPQSAWRRFIPALWAMPQRVGLAGFNGGGE